jgi:ribosomal subunit interface protein
MMHISVKGKQLDVGEAWRTHVEATLPEIVGKYFENAQGAQITLGKQGSTFHVDVVVHIGKKILVQSHGATGDAYSAFEEAANHLATRLRRYKRRLRDHHQRPDQAEALPAQQYVLAGESGEAESEEKDEPIVIAEMETGIETLSVGEAVMRMDLANLPALMFRNRAHGGLNMVYHRGDGHIGWVDPRGNRRGESGDS